ncbi:MAG: phosphatase PAP2 family protein [Capsulimonadaceae bacterium]|nr:phosphatase PAP2 family protein [Capsulimonadaceae bacterium]
MTDNALSTKSSLLRRIPLRFLLPLVAYAALIPLSLLGYTESEPVHRACSLIGGQINMGMIYLTFALFCWSAYRRRKEFPRIVWWALDIALGTVILVDSWKLFRLPKPNGNPYGFPSGHTGLMFSLSWLMFEMYPALGPLWYVFAVVVAWSRIIVHAHYPYQVIAAAPMGFLVAWAVTDLDQGLFLPRIFTIFRKKSPPVVRGK